MGKGKYYYYFVEGKDEEKIVKVLKTDLQYIVPGKIQVFNVVQQKLTKPRLMVLKPETTVVLIFDTDTGKTPMLVDNINFLKAACNVKDVLCITQVKNLEDELIRSCNIKKIKELTDSKSDREYKHDLIKDNNFSQKLEKHNFDFGLFWNSVDDKFNGIPNNAEKIKIKK